MTSPRRGSYRRPPRSDLGDLRWHLARATVARPQRAGGRVERALGLGLVGLGDPVRHQREQHLVAVLVDRDAGQAADVAQRAGLGPHQPARVGERLVEPVGERAREAGHRQCGGDCVELWVPGVERQPEHLDQGQRGDPVLSGQAAAVVDLEVGGDAQAPRVWVTAAAPSANVPVPVTAFPTWWDSTSAPSLSLTSRTRATISRSGADCTDASSRPPAATPWVGAPTTVMPWATSAVGERLRGVQRRVLHPPGADRGPALVDPARGDPRDHVLGQVVRRPGGVERRLGEEGVVVAELHRGPPLLPQRGRGLGGEGPQIGVARGRPRAAASKTGRGRRRPPARSASCPGDHAVENRSPARAPTARPSR